MLKKKYLLLTCIVLCAHAVSGHSEEQTEGYAFPSLVTPIPGETEAPYQEKLTLSESSFWSKVIKKDIVLQKDQDLIISIDNPNNRWHLPGSMEDQAALYVEYKYASSKTSQELSLEIENSSDGDPLIYYFRAGHSPATVDVTFYYESSSVASIRGIPYYQRNDFNPRLHITIK